MAKSYVKFEVSKEVADKTYEALKLSKQGGTIRKGANEVTKSVERGLASFVVIAEDVEPEEVVMHLPALCEQKKIPYTYVPLKLELGKSIGLTVQCAAIAVEGQGSGASAISEIIGKVTGKSPTSAAQKAAAAPQREKPKEQQPKREQKPKVEKAAPAEKPEQKQA
jgi:large subunit ribosomal protein L7Ae